MPTVMLSNPTNSTMFTSCCSMALTEQQTACPSCGQRIEPTEPRYRWEAAYAADRAISKVRSNQ
jgi:hypothetical protein